jgi:hypothetical protein
LVSPNPVTPDFDQISIPKKESIWKMAAMVKVWVRLQIGDEKLEGGVLVKTSGDIDDLRRAVKEQLPEVLTHCAFAQLHVFDQEDAPPLEIDAPLPLNTTSQNPLIIKAPTNNQGNKKKFISE